MKTNHIPAGYHTITPYLVVKNASTLIDFLKEVFDAKETERVKAPNGRIMHAELLIGDSKIMLGEAAENIITSPSTLYIYVPNTDAVYKKALAAGGKSIKEPDDQYYGDRNAGIQDIAGNKWWIATHIEDVSSEELKKRTSSVKS